MRDLRIRKIFEDRRTGSRCHGTVLIFARQAGKKKEAAAALDRMVYVFPLDAGLHEKLGNLDIETGNTSGAVREIQVLVALNTGDKAGSHYNLAKAYKADGRDR